MNLLKKYLFYREVKRLRKVISTTRNELVRNNDLLFWSPSKVENATKILGKTWCKTNLIISPETIIGHMVVIRKENKP